MTTAADISVELIDHMGSDLSVVNAARVSFHKESEMVPVYEPRVEFDISHGDRPYDELVGHTLNDGDKKLIAYLAKHDHWSPFAHAFMSFRIKAPIFLARQLGKHQVGLAWNEVSRRYVDDEPEFYMPDGWRGRPTDGAKQGSTSETVPYRGAKVAVLDIANPGMGSVDTRVNHSKLCQIALTVYNDMLDQGIAPEMARMVLPQSMMTEWIWSGSVMAFARICKLRLDPHAQRENLQVAKPIAAAAATHFPESWKALLA